MLLVAHSRAHFGRLTNFTELQSRRYKTTTVRYEAVKGTNERWTPTSTTNPPPTFLAPALFLEELRCLRPSFDQAIVSLTTSMLLFLVPLPGFAADTALQSSSLPSLLQTIEALIQSAGPITGPLLFISIYALAAVFLVPASVLTIAAGFLFGPVQGTAIVSLAATLGATAAFLVGRYFARPLVSQKVADEPRFAAVDRAIAEQGAKIVLLLRLSPVFPYTLLNYGLSLTSIGLIEYVLASWVGMLPGTIAYVALGGAGKAAAEAASGGGISIVQLSLYGIGAAATLGATVLISRVAKNALDEANAKERN